MRLSSLLVAAASVSCSSSGAAPSGAGSSDGAAGAAAAVLLDFTATEADFDCNRNSEWTAVGYAHYKNMLGHTAEMLDVARSPDGGTYPAGTMVQLNPAEAMVKRGQGFNATSGDWEFFTLMDSDAGTTTIMTRGGGSSVSNARGTCLGCHAMVGPQWDFICADDPDGGATTAHGCNPLPVPNARLAALPDPRCP